MTSIYLSRETDHLGQIQAVLRSLGGFSCLAFELIQNADDAGAHEMGFDIGEEEVVVENDAVFSSCDDLAAARCTREEDGGEISRCDFHSFRLVAGGAKRARDDTTGAFGIGFTVVYQITDRPELVSSGNHWLLDETETVSRRIRVCPGCQRCAAVAGTRFYLPWARDPESPLRRALMVEAVSANAVDQLATSLLESVPSAILFLRNLDRVVVKRNGAAPGVVERASEGSDVLVSHPGGTALWRLANSPFNDEARHLRELHGPNIEGKRQSVASIAISRELGTPGLVCAYLPTEQYTGMVPFHINADFFTSPDRKRVLFENDYQAEWNRAALRSAAVALRQAVPDLPGLLGADALWRLAVDVWHAAKRADAGEVDVAIASLWDELRSGLVEAPVMWTSTKSWRLPGETVLLDFDEEQVLDALPILEGLGVSHIHPSLRARVKELEWKSALGIDSMTLSMLLPILHDKGLDQRIPLADAPACLSSAENRRRLWRLIGGLLTRVRSQDEREHALQTLREIALVLGRDGALWPCGVIHRADESTTSLLDELELNPPLANDAALDAAARIGGDLCSEFDGAAMVEILEEAIRSGSIREDGLQRAVPALLAWFVSEGESLRRDEDSVARLRALSVFPSSSGLRPLTDLYLPGGFEDPLGLAELIDADAARTFRTLFQDLGAASLEFRRYVLEFIPRAFEGANPIPPDQIRALVLDLAHHRLGELVDDEVVIATLAGLPLAECVDDDFREPPACYFDSADVREVLGEEAAIVRLPEDARDSVTALFRRLGVSDELRLADIVESVGRIITTPPSQANRQRIQRVIEYLGENLRDAPSLPRALFSFRTLGWLPIINELDHWGAPSQLYTVFRRHLFESQAAFLDLPLTAQRRAAHFLGLLGVESEPTCELVVSHLRSRALVGESVSADVYRFLDEQADDPHVAQLKGTECLHIGDGRYLSPESVFWEENPFGSFRYQLGSEFRGYGRLLDRLGVRARPDHTDAKAVLLDIATRFGEQHVPLDDDGDRSVLLVCWKWLDRALEDDEMEPSQLAELSNRPVINDAAWLLRKPMELLEEDLPGMAVAFGDLIAQYIVPPRSGASAAMHAAGLRRLSERVTTAVVELDDPVEDSTLLAHVLDRRTSLQRIIEVEFGVGRWEYAASVLDQLGVISAKRLAREEWLKWRLIPNVLNAIAVNRRKLALKSAFLTWALVSLIATVLLLGGYFIYAPFWNRVRV